MKKLSSLIIAFLLVLALPVFSVSAAYEAELTVSKSEAETGETAEILISIANNPGLCALGFEVEYDKDVLKVISAEFTELFSDTSKRVNTRDGSILFNAASADNINGNGAVAQIVFKVTSADFKGTDVNVKLLGEKGFVLHSEENHTLADVTLKLYSGAVIPPAGTVTDAPVTDNPNTDAPITDAPVTACTHSKTASETVKASTCSTTGVAIIRCIDCGISLGETELPLAEHTPGEWNTVSNEEIQKCTVCGEELGRKPVQQSEAVTTAPIGGSSREPDAEGGNTALIIIIVVVAVAVAGLLVFFTVNRSKTERRKQDEEYF